MAETESNAAVKQEDSQENSKDGPTDTLYIWGLSKDAVQAEIKDEFEKFAKVVRVTIIKDKITQVSKGFGYVLLESADEATKALKEMDGRIIADNPIHVKYSFSGTPDWMKFLDGKMGDRGRGRSPRGRGRGHFGGRGRGDFGRDGGGYDDHSYGNDQGGYSRRGGRDNFGLKPYGDERRPRDAGYNGRPYQRPETGYGRPSREDLLYRSDPYRPGSSRDSLYAPVDRTEVYEERKDLYRPSDDQRYQDPIIRRDGDYLGVRAEQRPPVSDYRTAEHRAPVDDYRARSPVGRPAAAAPPRDYYGSARPPAASDGYGGYPQPADSRYPSAPADSRYPSAPADSRYPSAPADSRYPSAPADSRYPSDPADSRYPSAPSDSRYPSAADTRYPSAPADTRYPQAYPPPAAAHTHAPVDYRAQQYNRDPARVSYDAMPPRSIVGKMSDPYAQVGPS